MSIYPKFRKVWPKGKADFQSSKVEAKKVVKKVWKIVTVCASKFGESVSALLIFSSLSKGRTPTPRVNPK